MSVFIKRANQQVHLLQKCYNTDTLSYKVGNKGYTIVFMDTNEVKRRGLFDTLFCILENNMKELYTNSIGWDKDTKLAELMHENGKFLIVVDTNNINIIMGYCYFHFMAEAEADVVYCYELQVKEEYRGIHIGLELMKILEDIGMVLQLDFVMLTCFKDNPALHFYKKIGYQIDEISPSEPQCSYEILSKECETPLTICMEVITFLLTLRIKENADMEGVRKTAALMAENTWNKAGTRFYQYYQKEADKLEYIEVFSDSQTALAHLTNQNEELLQKWFSVIEVKSCLVVGRPSNELENTVRSLVTEATFVESMGGYEPRGP